MDLGYMSCRRKNYVQAAYVEGAVYINKVLGADRAYQMLIRENLPVAVIERVLRGDSDLVRKKDRRYSTRRETIREPQLLSTPSELRKDHLTSQRVQVALVFRFMLGIDSAEEYLREVRVPVWVSERVLHSIRRRPSPEFVTD